MQFVFDEFILDTDRFELCRDGNPVPAQPKVIELLVFLMENRGRLISKNELNEEVWQGRVVTDSALSSMIKVARQVLGDDGQKQQYIRTVHKKGFIFSASVEISPSREMYRSGSIPAPKRNAFNAVSGSTMAAPRPFLAVTAFSNLSNDPAQAYIADGITEDITTTLSKISKLTVVAYPAVKARKDFDGDHVQRAREQGVSHLLEGSVQSDEQRLRISVRLIDLATGQHLWAQRYDRENQALFELQDEVTKDVVSALQVELTEGEQALLVSRGTDNIEAWQLTFQGESAMLEHRKISVRRGREQLKKAVALDQNYVLAWSSLATAHFKESLNNGWSPSRPASLALAIEASDRAVALDPLNASALATRSLIMISKREFDEAVELAEKALFYANSEANTIAIAAISLRACCRPEQSIKYTEKAMELCPIYPAWYPYGNSLCYWMLKQYDLAIAKAEEAVNIDPHLSLCYFSQAMIFGETGDETRARQAVRKLLAIDPGFSSAAYIEGMPFSDPKIEFRRKAALKNAGMPD